VKNTDFGLTGRGGGGGGRSGKMWDMRRKTRGIRACGGWSSRRQRR